MQLNPGVTTRRLIAGAIRLWAAVSRPFRRHRPVPSGPIKRILLLNGAHIGDVVISTSLLPVLRDAYPGAEFGFLVGSWSLPVVQGHPEVSFTHVIDHWRLNRSKQSPATKLLRTWRMSRKAKRQIRQVGYDAALSLHCWYPDFVHLAWSADIPTRVAYRHSWFAAFATHLVQFPQQSFIHQGRRIAEILRPLPGVTEAHLAKRHSLLAASTPSSQREVCDLLNVSRIEDARYVVVHVGSGEPGREMPTEFWRAIAAELSRDEVLLFTGRGERERQMINGIIEGLDHCVSGCDRLTWNGFVTAVRNARKLYGVESMAGHVAAAVGTPCTVVYTGTAGVARWRPEGDLTTVFTQHVPCAPCGIPSGCDHMTCIRAITPETILRSEKGVSNQ